MLLICYHLFAFVCVCTYMYFRSVWTHAAMQLPVLSKKMLYVHMDSAVRTARYSFWSVPVSRLTHSLVLCLSSSTYSFSEEKKWKRGKRILFAPLVSATWTVIYTPKAHAKFPPRASDTQISQHSSLTERGQKYWAGLPSALPFGWQGHADILWLIAWPTLFGMT